MENHGNNEGRNCKVNTLSEPSDVFSDGKRLYICDTGNNRVLIYNKIPDRNNASADIVIGQPDFRSNSPNTKWEKIKNDKK